MIKKNSHTCRFTKRKEKVVLLSAGEQTAKDTLVVFECEGAKCKRELASDIKERVK